MGNRIYLASPTMHQEEQVFIQEAFDTNWVAPLGKNVDEFEKGVAEFVGVKSAAALNAGTAALHLAVKLAGVRRGDKVFCSDLTFSATVNPVSYEGGEQVFIDSERETWNMDPRALERAFERYPDCRCVIAANLYGTPAKLDEIRDICDAHGAVFIEDAAESLSATYKGRQTGTFGQYNALSFNGNKIITTSGGGMLLSDDEAGISKARFWATQAREPYPWYEHKEIGYNYRMSNIVAGIGRGQLIHLLEHRTKKEAIYRTYEKAFQGLPVRMNPHLPYSQPNFWLSCMTIDPGCTVTPEQIRLALEEENIESRPIWKRHQDGGLRSGAGDFCDPGAVLMYRKFFKRFFDVLLSGCALILLSPVLLIVAVLVRTKLGSPVIFCQERPGKNEKIFKMYKFRSMTDARDENGVLLPDEVRLTRLGRILRSTSLDELPELWNILRGDMSIVGPRPLLVKYLPLYNEEQRHRHDVRPGLTGLSQAAGDVDMTWERQFQLDVGYADHVTLAGDVKIVVLTVKRVLVRNKHDYGGYVREEFRGSEKVER